MPTSHRSRSSRLSLAKMVCMIFVFLAAMAIVSPAQILTTLHSFAGPRMTAALPSQGSSRLLTATSTEQPRAAGPIIMGWSSKSLPQAH
jgi:hypothetical protein